MSENEWTVVGKDRKANVLKKEEQTPVECHNTFTNLAETENNTPTEEEKVHHVNTTTTEKKQMNKYATKEKKRTEKKVRRLRKRMERLQLRAEENEFFENAITEAEDERTFMKKNKRSERMEKGRRESRNKAHYQKQHKDCMPGTQLEG